MLMKNYLSNRFQRVRLNGSRSELRLVTSGVPQGSLLGPYLFGLYVSSLRSVYASSCMVKYMDDVCLICGIRKKDFLSDLSVIKAEIQNISMWSSANGLFLNVSKMSGLI